ncbi:MAG: NAD(+)/NADH kinase [Actinobacteria bacterium]|nr:MAG: NAD(+)/NADH kinase [Actinomycetota bacterium]
MSKREDVLESGGPQRTALSCFGLVVHPTRDVDEPVGGLRRWAQAHGTRLVQVRVPYDQQRIADQGNPEECDLLIAIGGDGTALAAIRAGVRAGRPVLAVACGSLGVLTSVGDHGLLDALERFSRGDWVPRRLPGLEIRREDGSQLFALNDIVIRRGGAGQLRLNVQVDGGLFARLAGDGCVVSTAVGSSAYALAAGGPLVEPELDAFLITPLNIHGGFCPPLVVGATSLIRFEATSSYGGAQLELDGQEGDTLVGPLTIGLGADMATLVGFSDQKSFLAVLRERGIIIDSPRILAEDARNARR